MQVVEAILSPLLAGVTAEIPQGRYPGPAAQQLHDTVNARDATAATALHLAAHHGHLECVVSLVEGGANVFALDEDQSNCLHFAALGGHGMVVAYLLSKTGNVGLTRR